MRRFDCAVGKLTFIQGLVWGEIRDVGRMRVHRTGFQTFLRRVCGSGPCIGASYTNLRCEIQDVGRMRAHRTGS